MIKATRQLWPCSTGLRCLDNPVDKYLDLDIPNTEATAHWLQECGNEKRGRQIEAAFSPEAGVRLATYSDRSTGKLELIEVSIKFLYGNFERASAEFLTVGEQLQFPPGTKLVHVVTDWKNSVHSFTRLATW